MFEFIIGLVILGFILSAAVFLFQLTVGFIVLIIGGIISVPVMVFEKIKEKIKE